ncbi:hypothetical protein [Citrobacter freundii]|nr:hypothetical protein [Citrobacter freundii]MDH0215690.1 hypothetical protein [Citrobacter freundii]MDH0227453.1 hypothetical protein [Citrobacter freundii]MDH0984818.1 hypothetical protein [Citrobacter freundii]MDH1348696.1 hypothetical protein [Citrobacter freundii]MDO3404931.1 hypothetical protein [Citrobacter freundii]
MTTGFGPTLKQVWVLVGHYRIYWDTPCDIIYITIANKPLD